jgi:hypothetical protein
MIRTLDFVRRFFSAMRECWTGLMMLNTST